MVGNPQIFTVARVPTEAEEQRRMWTRQGKQLQRQRLSLASQGRSLVLTHGVSVSNAWWKERRWKRLVTELPAGLVKAPEIFRRGIRVLEEEIGKLRAEVLAQRKPGRIGGCAGRRSWPMRGSCSSIGGGGRPDESLLSNWVGK